MSHKPLNRARRPRHIPFGTGAIIKAIAVAYDLPPLLFGLMHNGSHYRR
jgi:hypothetical protein